MKKEYVDNSVWLRNFNNALGEMIKEQKDNGYTVRSVLMTEAIYNKLSIKLGYNPTDILGYIIEIIEQNEEQRQEEGDIVMISGDPLN